MEADLLTPPDTLEEYQEVRHGFKVAANSLLIPKGIYSEVVSRPRICSIPATPSWFSGFINHRGETVPIYDLTAYVGQVAEDPRNEKRWVLLLDEHPHMVGILLDSPPQGLVAPAPTEQQDDALNEKLRAYAGSRHQHQDTLWNEFEHREFFTTLKQQF